jgi:hypothetical protein
MDSNFIKQTNLVLDAIDDAMDENLLYAGFKLQQAEDWVLESFGVKDPIGDLSAFYRG